MVPKVPPNVENTILRLWTQGFDKSHICRYVELTWPTVHRIIKEWEAGPGKDFSRKPRDPKTYRDTRGPRGSKVKTPKDPMDIEP